MTTPLNPAWDHLTQLHWKADLVAEATGIHVAVTTGNLKTKRLGRWVPVKGYYSYALGNTSGGLGTFSEAWAWLNGLQRGLQNGANNIVRR